MTYQEKLLQDKADLSTRINSAISAFHEANPLFEVTEINIIAAPAYGQFQNRVLGAEVKIGLK